jgi:hypothetical protein
VFAYILRSGGLFNLILLSAFLAFSSLGAGSGKWTRKPLGAHQERISIAMKENTAVVIYNQITFPVLEMISLHQCIISSFASFRTYRSLTCYFALRNKKNLAPNKRTISTRETKKILRWKTASTSIEFGQNNDRVTAST